MSTVERIGRICGRDLDERALRIELLGEIRAAVPAQAYAWLLTDPETGVGSSPLAETPRMADLPRLIRLKYLTTTNRWTGLAAGSAVTLGADRGQSLVWRELLAGYGVEDVASTVFRDRYGCWGFLDLWRIGGTFSPAERDLLAAVSREVTPALRRSLVGTFSAGPRPGPEGPVVLLLGNDLGLRTQTPATDAYLRALLPTGAERVPVPAAAYNVAAQLVAREDGIDGHPPWVRAHLGGGAWVTLRAARLAEGSAIAVSIEPTPPPERAELYARVVGLSERERELLAHLVAGCDTRELAERLFVSEHTVQDHLKSVFAKTGAANRRILVARATGAV